MVALDLRYYVYSLRYGNESAYGNDSAEGAFAALMIKRPCWAADHGGGCSGSRSENHQKLENLISDPKI